jgi:hypothetical protein
MFWRSGMVFPTCVPAHPWKMQNAVQPEKTKLYGIGQKFLLNI